MNTRTKRDWNKREIKELFIVPPKAFVCFEWGKSGPVGFKKVNTREMMLFKKPGTLLLLVVLLVVLLVLLRVRFIFSELLIGNWLNEGFLWWVDFFCVVIDVDRECFGLTVGKLASDMILKKKVCRFGGKYQVANNLFFHFKTPFFFCITQSYF